MSTEEQKESGHSLRNQEDVLTRYCNLNKYNILGIYVEDYTATTFDRPEWTKLTKYVSQNKKRVDQVLLLRWDRFSRNLEQALGEIRKYRENFGVEINTMDNKIDYSLPEFPLMLALYLGVSEVEKNKITMRTKEGIRRAQLDGYWTNSAPYGYKNCSIEERYHSLEIDEEKAVKVRQAFEMFGRGIYSMDQVRHKLKFSLARQNFINMLSNPVYIGKIYVKPYGKEDAQVVEGKHQGIIDENLFNKVQIIRKGRVKKQQKVKPQSQDYFLKDFLKCPKCGKGMLASKSKGKMGQQYFYYHCNPCQERYRTDLVHKTLYDTIRNLKVRPEVLELIKEVRKDIKKENIGFKNESLTKLYTKQEQLQSRMFSLQDKMLDGEITTSDYTLIKARNELEISEIEEEIKGFEQMKTNFDKEMDYTIDFIKNLDKILINSDIDDKRRILSSIFTEKLVFSENKLLNFFSNEFLSLIFQDVSELQNKKRGKKEEISSLPRSVAGTRVELVTSGL